MRTSGRSTGRGTTTARTRRWGIATRLLALVGVPLVGLLVLAGALTRARVEATDTSTRIEHEVDRVSRLAALRAALHAEQVPLQTIMEMGPVGVDPQTAERLLGFNAQERLEQTRAETDARLAVLGGDSALVPADELRAIRDDGIEDRAPADEVLQRFFEIDQRLTREIDRSVVSIESLIGDVTGGPRVDEALRAIRASNDASQLVGHQLQALRVIFLDQAAGQRSVVDLATLTSRFEVDRELLASIDEPTIAKTWAEVDAGSDAQAFRKTVDDSLDESVITLEGGDLVAMGAAVQHGLAYADGINDVNRLSSEAVRRIATDIRQQSTDELRQWLVFAGGLMAITVVSSVLFVRSISGPLRRLAAHAEAVGRGDLDVEPLTTSRHGDGDMATTFEAFDDLVGNLRLIEAKVQALSACDFDAPAMAEPLPGELGRSLEQSVTVLSGSILERDRLREHVDHQATHDGLTGLHNRLAANDAVELALMRCRRAQSRLAVLFVDLDDFKRANDTYGHGIGDRVLRGVAARMGDTVGEQGFLARLGGDEFMVLIEDVTDAADVTVLARDLCEAIADPLDVDDLHITVRASVGIAFSSDGTEAADQVLAWADLAVNRAKQSGAGPVELYDQSLQQQLLERAHIEEALSAALPQDELFLQYQPVTDLRTGAVSGVEALVRWERPGFGIQPPDSFIPVAETSSLIIDLDRWVMARAARQIREWAGSGPLAGIDVAVNVSGRHLVSHTLVDHVRELLAGTGIDPCHLVIEITETVLVNDLATAAEQLEEIRSLGVRIALDDFGTGYTSITHLQQLPVDIIKIDRSFIERLGNERDRTLLRMITDLGHHLGLTITAEGVETAEQLEVLNELGCDRAQGFLMSRPLNPADLVERMQGETSLLPDRGDAVRPVPTGGVPAVEPGRHLVIAQTGE